MKISNLTIIIFVLLVFNLLGQNEEILTLQTETGKLEGTLLVPEPGGGISVALIIAGSGPTDRNGNNPMMKNNSLKMLAEELAENNIASLRFDKRGVGKSASAAISEIDLRFDHYINDATKWLDTLQKDNRFKNVVVIGHSQGSLIGMIIARRSGADKFISIAGSGESISKTIRQQLQAQPPFVLSQSTPILEKLEIGETVDDVPEILNSLFRRDIQPYMISWIKYDPQKEISKLKIPILIIQGTTDIQVSVKNAELLKEANTAAELRIIDGMNHILKKSVIDRLQNIMTYSNPDLPLVKILVQEVVKFIKK